jgi:diguanylate cyclase (GGDEF)-like protein
MTDLFKGKILDALEAGRNAYDNPLSETLVGLGRIAHELLEENERLKKELLTDPLTSIPSFRAYKEYIEPELLAYFDDTKERRKYPTDFVVMIADLDNLKRINDTQGHPQGDIAIIESAQILQRSIRSQDWVSRHGEHADEFIVVVRLGDEDNAQLVLERILERIQECSVASEVTGISISIGAAIASEYATLVDTLDNAEQAMYVNKRSKR